MFARDVNDAGSALPPYRSLSSEQEVTLIISTGSIAAEITVAQAGLRTLIALFE